MNDWRAFRETISAMTPEEMAEMIDGLEASASWPLLSRAAIKALSMLVDKVPPSARDQDFHDALASLAVTLRALALEPGTSDPQVFFMRMRTERERVKAEAAAIRAKKQQRQPT